MTGRPHVVVIHRWLARYAEYHRYIDHDEYAVSYVSTVVGAPSVPAGAVDVVTVNATDDLAEVAECVEQLAEKHGRPCRIMALKEDDLLVAAELRALWGCEGPTVAEVLPFRDKLMMNRAVAAAGLELPPFANAPDVAAVERFAAEHGWPLIVKPRIGSSSAGVSRLDGPQDLSGLDLSGTPHLVQLFDPRTVYHVDGCFDGTGIGPIRASRYLNSCMGFRTGDRLGAVEEDDPVVCGAIAEYAAGALRALTDRPTTFHLEAFVDRDTARCAFLEVGARVGGGDIPFLWREVHGYDLMEAGFRIGLGLDPRPWPAPLDVTAIGGADREEVAGWLLVPAPARRPCVITEATPMVGRVPGPYAEALLSPGEVLPAADAYYEHVGGRFRFRGTTSGEVEEAVTVTARDFRVSGSR